MVMVGSRVVVALALLVVFTCVASVEESETGTEYVDEAPDDIAEAIPLQFTDGLYDMSRNIGRPVTMKCSVNGVAPLNVFLIHDYIATYRRHKKRMIKTKTIYDPAKPNELSVIYVIDSLKKNQAGVYRCQAESGDGKISLSTMELFAVDPCEGVTCGYKEQCVNVKGTATCTCDFDCPQSESPVCVAGITYASLCHLSRMECRNGGPVEAEIQAGKCAAARVVTEASCTLSGEGHVRMFDGDYYTFRGTCPYKMAEDTRDGMFIAYARTEICGENGKSNCLRSVTMYVDRIYGFSIERGWLINDNGRSRNIQNKESIILGGGLVVLQRLGKTMVGTITNKKIKFYYDGLNYFKITVPLAFVEKKTDFGGFCGSIPVDYMPALMGKDVGALEQIISMPGLSHTCKAEFITESTVTNCPESENITIALSKSEGLAACKSVIPMDMYIKNAVFDTCNCALMQDLNYCFCNIAYSYQEDCRQAGVDVVIDSKVCEKNFHQQSFREERINYRRMGRWYYNKRT